MTEEKPIGVFDSGVGGLTVLKSLIASFPNESFIYLGDTARLPYGSKSFETIHQYLIQNTNYLKKMGVKAIIIACNSASSVLKSDAEMGIPIFDVIKPGARQAILISKNKRIGIIGTRATIKARAYVKAIEAYGQFSIFQQACPLLVPFVEEGMSDDPITNLIIYRYLAGLLKQEIDTLILGCTHYPALKPAIQKVVGQHITLIDSGEAIVERLSNAFNYGKIEKNKQVQRFIRILVTDASSVFEQVALNLLKPYSIDGIELIDI